ncbi:hypothetical protein GCM10009429_00730 [Dyella marensis]
MDMKRPLQFIALATLLALAGCQNPHDHELPSDISKIDEGTRDAIKKLPNEERELVAKYALRHTFGGDKPSGIGVTIGQAIQEQKEFEAARAQREAEAAALKASMQKEHDDAISRMNNSVAVALVSKAYEASNFREGTYEDTIQLEIAIENKTDKAIAGVKGTAVFRDMFGDIITRSNVAITHDIQPGAKYLWQASKHYNQFEQSDKTLRSTPTEKIKFEFEPDTIVFADGTKQTAPSVGAPD